MKHIFSEAISRRIKQYSLLTAAYVSCHVAEGQNIYTDLDPDIVLNDDGEFGGVDIDADGNYDFAFKKLMWTGATYWGSLPVYFTQIWCGPYSPDNSIAAAAIIIGSAASSSFTQEFPYLINEGEFINASFSFQNAGYQLMAARAFNYTGDLIDFAGYWWPVNTEKFLGIRFKDDSDQMHYGWIRCTIPDSTETLIIHDYAYSIMPEVAILAGDTVNKGSNLSNTSTEIISLYSFNNILHIAIDGTEAGQIKLSIFNIIGDCVLNTRQSESSFQVSLNHLPQGWYIAAVDYNGLVANKIIFVE